MRFVSLKRLLRGVYEIYRAQRIPVAAAGLAFFLTLTLFPLLICLQTMLGSLFPPTEELRSFLAVLLPRDTVDALLSYLRYASENQSHAMLAAAISLLVTSSSAAFRVVDRVMGEMRGRRRFSGAFAWVFSFCFSLFFLAAIYFAVILIVSGKWVLDLADRHIYFMNVAESWRWWRFVLLFLLLFVLLGGVYRITAPKRGGGRVLPGAAAASVCLVAFSVAFSAFLGAGAKYPLIYGSLAGVVLVMLWLYTCGVVLFLGNALNVALERCG